MISKRLEIIIDALQHQANEHDVELTFDETFDDERSNMSFIINNMQTNDFGIISTDVREFPDDPVCFFIFNDKMYVYCKAEGFNRKQMLESFDNEVLKKVSQPAFFSFILGLDK